MVATKLDQRLGSWNTAQDADSFINPPADVFGGGTLLGGSPFFTSVPPRHEAGDVPAGAPGYVLPGLQYMSACTCSGSNQ